jgi:uncharacterized damage-inducible protein DinB
MYHARPSSAEYAPYYQSYISKVEGDNFLEVLSLNTIQTLELLESLSSEKWEHTYETGKWTIKELLVHLMDTERIMTNRALRIARNDQTPIPGFEHNDYVPNSNAGNRSPQSIIDEYKAVREATIQLFKNFDEKAFQRIGTANGQAVSVLALGFIITGHELHHMEVLKARYLDNE